MHRNKSKNFKKEVVESEMRKMFADNERKENNN
jgi:hypothetical protein